jgi:hypothetical protein
MLVVQTAVSFLSRIPPTLAPTLGPRVGWPAESVGYLTALISGGSIFVLLLAAPLQRRLGSMRTCRSAWRSASPARCCARCRRPGHWWWAR